MPRRTGSGPEPAKARARRPRITKKGRETAELYDFFARTYVRHAEKEWYDTPFVLEDWQYDNMWLPVFGTVREGHRWYRKALFGLPRWYGKSTFAARMVETIINMEVVPAGEYGIIATSEEQARIVFEKVARMIRLSPELSVRFEVQRRKIICRETGATIETFPADEGAIQGHHFTVAIMDEAHVWRNTALYDAVVGGMKGQKDTLLVIITTAGPARKGPLWDTIIPQMQADPHSYVYWLSAQSLADQQAGRYCDYRNESVWKRVLAPSFISLDDIRDQYNTLSFSNFIRYVLNVFPPPGLEKDMAFSFDDVSAAVSCEGEYNWDGEMTLGIDGAVSGDTFALVFMADGGSGLVDCWPIVFDDPTMEGRYDLVQIEELVLECWNGYDVRRIGVDPARLVMFSQHLIIRYGVPIETYTQDGRNMSAASTYLETLLVDRRLRVYGPDREKFAEQCMNCTRDPAGQYEWRMGKTGVPGRKIDAPIAASIAAVLLDQSAGDGGFICGSVDG